MSTADDIKRLLVDLMDFAPHWSGNGMRRGGDYVLLEDVEQVLYPAIDALASERDALKDVLKAICDDLEDGDDFGALQIARNAGRDAIRGHQAKALDTSSRSTADSGSSGPSASENIGPDSSANGRSLDAVACDHLWNVTSQRLQGMWCKCAKCGATKEETWD